MIITKKTAMRNNTRSARGHIIAAVDYIYKDVPSGRVGEVWTSPEMQDIGTERNAIKGMMLGTAEMNERARNPIRHYVITWREGEELSPEMVQQMLTAAGVQEHQWVFVRHHDHDAEGHQHGHLLVNSIHPQTFKSNNFFNDIKTMMMEVAKIAHARGWDRTDAPEYQNARYRVTEDGEIEDQKEIRDKAIPKERDRAAERHGELASMETYLNAVKEELFPKKDSLKGMTWQDFHAALARHGLQYVQKGSGAIWTWTHAAPDGGEPVTETRKASVIPSFSLKKIEKVLGPYQPAQHTEKNITAHVASPTNPATADRAAEDLARVRTAAAQTRKGIQKRQLVQAVQLYRHDPKTKRVHTQGRIAQAQTRAMEARQKAAEKRAQEEAARARAELLRRQAQEEAERRKKAEREAEEARRREQERIQKEKEEARKQGPQKGLYRLKEWTEQIKKEAEEARKREHEQKEQEEARARAEARQRWEAEEQERDVTRIEINHNIFTRTAAQKDLETAMRETWYMDWRTTKEAQEYTAQWLSDMGYDISTQESQDYLAYWGHGGPAHQEALAREDLDPADLEDQPAIGR